MGSLAVSVLLAMASTARATIVEYFPLERLARESELIIEGKVLAVEAAWDDVRRHIWTRAGVGVTRTFKGEVGDECELFTLGGMVGDTGQHVSGVARFEVGERVLVFCFRDVEGRWRTLGMAQGKFRVQQAGDGGDPWVENSHAGLSFLDPSSGRKVSHATTRLRSPVFVARLEAILAEQQRADAQEKPR